MKRAATMAFLWATTACSNPIAAPSTRALDRPDSVAFVCFRLSDSSPAGLAHCTLNPADATLVDTNYAMHALVAQTARGEIAAIQLDGTHPGIRDTDARVPGFTFVTVGEVPAAVLTPRLDPTLTYVVDHAGVHIIETDQFRQSSGATVRDANAVLPPEEHPSDMVLSPDERALWVALPETGQIAYIPIDGADVQPAQFVPLSTVVPAPVDLRGLTAVDLPPDYRVTCPRNAVLQDPAIAAPRTPAPGLLPRPGALAVDAELNQLLVADLELPIIHVIDMRTRVELDPISVAVPTIDLVITPRVPATFEDRGACDDTHACPGGETCNAGLCGAPIVPTERFIYAIDAIDGSVLVVDYSDPTRASYGAVLPVGVQQVRTADRITLPFPARALGIVTSDYLVARTTLDPDPAGGLPTDMRWHTANSREPTRLCNDSDGSSPADFRGVFLAVATTDGRLRMVDVYDLDGPCRGDAECNAGRTVYDADDQRVFLRRHRPRIGAFIQSTTPVSPTEGPTWATGTGGSIAVSDDGTTGAPDLLPDLRPIDTCPPSLDRIFPVTTTEPIRICSVTDPWGAINQVYSVAYEGVIPGTAHTGGNLDDAMPAIDARLDFCSLGVLGSEDHPTSGELSDYGGDQIAITSPLPQATTDDPACMRMITNVAGEPTPVFVPIARAFTLTSGAQANGRLELAIDAGRWMEITRCFPELVAFDVRSTGSFVVASTRDGMLHRVTRGADGRCQVDPTAPELQRGRAFFDQDFVSPMIALRLGSRPTSVVTPRLDFTVGNVPAAVAIDLSLVPGSAETPSLLTRITWNDVEQRLYAVDQVRRGLIRMKLQPVTIELTFP